MAPPNEIDPTTVQEAGDRLVAVAPEADGAMPGVYGPDLDAMYDDEGVIDARVAAIELLQVLRDRAEHQGKLDLAAYDAYKDI